MERAFPAQRFRTFALAGWDSAEGQNGQQCMFFIGGSEKLDYR
jgi:hypothetical protein